MSVTRWSRRFSQTTRGQIIGLLRRTNRTVEELAKALGLTDNAVRAHLTTLERDGLVRHAGVRRIRTAGKPAHAYSLAPEAEGLFSGAYIPFLTQLLPVLAERMPADEINALMRIVGRRLASAHPAPTGDAGARVQAAAALHNELGGLTEVEARGGAFTIRGYSCPLGALAGAHPEVCAAVQGLVTALTRLTVRQRCDRDDDRARCRLEVAAPSRTPGRHAARRRRSR